MLLAYLEHFIVCVFLRVELVVRLHCQEYLPEYFHSLFLWKVRTECTQAAFGSEGAGIGRPFSSPGQVLNLGFSLFRPFAATQRNRNIYLPKLYVHKNSLLKYQTVVIWSDCSPTEETCITPKRQAVVYYLIFLTRYIKILTCYTCLLFGITYVEF